MGWRLQWRKLALWGCVGAFVPYLVYVLANMIQFTSIFMVSFPFFGFLPEENISIREFIRSLF
jgi:hypothetical protein